MKLELVLKNGKKKIISGVVSFDVMEEKTIDKEEKASLIAQTPTEGRVFEVNPSKMDRSQFEKKRNDKQQEWTRQMILKAFEEVDRQAEKYNSVFYTLIPARQWRGAKTFAELDDYARNFLGEMADWVQQSLEWAQRISNGEGWDAVCNEADFARCYRMVKVQNDYIWLVGGALDSGTIGYPASSVSYENRKTFNLYSNVVPLVVLKERLYF